MTHEGVTVKEPTLQPYPIFQNFVYNVAINQTIAIPVDFEFGNTYYSRDITPKSIRVILNFLQGELYLPVIPGLRFLLGNYTGDLIIFECGILFLNLFSI